MSIGIRKTSRSQEQHNFHHLTMNAMWFGLALAATTRFLSVFAIRLGATPLELGLMSSLPGLAALVATTFLSQRWMRHFRDSVRAVFLPALGVRFNFFLLALTGFIPEAWRSEWIVLSVTVAAFAEGVSSVVFTVMMREAVPVKRITSLLSRRQIAMNLTLGISILLFGYWLESAPFPANYQVMFAAGFLFTLVSLWHTLRVRVPEEDSILAHTPPPSGVRVWRIPSFQIVAFAAAASHIAFFSIVPVTALRIVSDLGAGEQFMALFGMVELIAAIIISMFTSRIVARIGNRATIALAMIGTGFAALALALATSLPVTLVAAALSGASWTAVSTGLFGFFAENVPADDMPRFTTAYTQVVYVAIFIGPLLGSNLANAGTNLVVVLLLGAILRFLAGVFTTDYGTIRLRRLMTANFLR